MNLRKLFLWFILIDFSIFSAWVMWQVGYVGIWQAGFESPGSLQILLDLAISCLVICTWLGQDAKARGINPLPWYLAILSSGSLAVLLYLALRENHSESRQNNKTQTASPSCQ